MICVVWCSPLHFVLNSQALQHFGSHSFFLLFSFFDIYCDIGNWSCRPKSASFFRKSRPRDSKSWSNQRVVFSCARRGMKNIFFFCFHTNERKTSMSFLCVVDLYAVMHCIGSNSRMYSKDWSLDQCDAICFDFIFACRWISMSINQRGMKLIWSWLEMHECDFFLFDSYLSSCVFLVSSSLYTFSLIFLVIVNTSGEMCWLWLEIFKRLFSRWKIQSSSTRYVLNSSVFLIHLSGWLLHLLRCCLFLGGGGVGYWLRVVQTRFFSLGRGSLSVGRKFAKVEWNSAKVCLSGARF